MRRQLYQPVFHSKSTAIVNVGILKTHSAFDRQNAHRYYLNEAVRFCTLTCSEIADSVEVNN